MAHENEYSFTALAHLQEKTQTKSFFTLESTKQTVIIVLENHVLPTKVA